MNPLLLVLLALAPVGKTGALFDAEVHSLEAHGVAAADPRAPSADVARVKAERQARADARDKLRRALSALGHHGDATADNALLDGATTKGLDYGADGSVTLTLALSTESLGPLRVEEHKKAKR
jgi:hypothetical protein